ncbi:hypothetical protein D3093_10415 [Azospirillum argentinense]|uniref:Uncharacterized protein n=1 Tax=Azospirillum argentinense TaxID=2970906 RepID=A0A4D8PLU0_9PROT|nr:hypothetical protein D3093_10415 [Azospirillum argentinense]
MVPRIKANSQCPHPNPPPLTQGRGLPPLRAKLPPLRSGGGPGWGPAPAHSSMLRARTSRLPAWLGLLTTPSVSIRSISRAAEL